MKKLLTFILIFVVLPIYSQEKTIFDSIKKIDWNCYITSLPTIIGSYETYTLTKHRFKHRFAEGRRNWKLHINYKKRKLIKVGNKKSIMQGLEYFIKHKNNDSYNVEISSLDKKKLFDKMINSKYLKLNDSILNLYLTHDTLQIQYKEFNTEYSKLMDALAGVIDGAVFSISLDLINYNDTTKYFYGGNIYDGVKDTQVNDFLLYYDLKTKFNVFANLRIREYFAEDNFYNVILRYIAYKEGTVERKLPFIKNRLIK